MTIPNASDAEAGLSPAAPALAPPTIWSFGPPAVPAWADRGPLRSLRARRLPRWLPLPVLICGPLSLAAPLAAVAVFPKAGVAALAVLIAVAVVVRWVARGAVSAGDTAIGVAGLGWGGVVATTATVAVATALVGNNANVDDFTYVSVIGPIIEEFAKAGFVLWALWRARAVTSTLDGIVVAWWCAAGFAVIENIDYFYDAGMSGNLANVIIIRGVASPFAHLLFATIVGAVGGYAASRCWGTRRTLRAVAIATIAAAFLHGAWNQLAYRVAEDDITGTNIALFAAVGVGFIALFWATAVAVAVIRDTDIARNAAARQDATARHPNLADYDEATIATVALLASADIEPCDETVRHQRLAAALRTPQRARRSQAATEGGPGGTDAVGAWWRYVRAPKKPVPAAE